MSKLSMEQLHTWASRYVGKGMKLPNSKSKFLVVRYKIEKGYILFYGTQKNEIVKKVLPKKGS